MSHTLLISIFMLAVPNGSPSNHFLNIETRKEVPIEEQGIKMPDRIM